MSGRHGDRRQDHTTERQNEYFIPGDGISREVIQADICRYLGNDALVRPGNYQGRSGYFIRAYRNLTTEMIADLKEDSRRWATERTQMQQMGYGSAPSYLSSSVHDERQQLGPTPGPMLTQPMGGGQAQYGGQYGGPQGISQPPYGSGPPYSTQDYSGQSYTYTSGPPSTYPSSTTTYSYDSNYGQPRSAPHTTSPYGDPAGTYGGSTYGGSTEDYQSSSGGYYSASSGTGASQTGYQTGIQPQSQGYPPRDPVGFNNTDPRAVTAHTRQDAGSRGDRRDPPRRHR